MEKEEEEVMKNLFMKMQDQTWFWFVVLTMGIAILITATIFFPFVIVVLSGGFMLLGLFYLILEVSRMLSGKNRIL